MLASLVHLYSSLVVISSLVYRSLLIREEVSSSIDLSIKSLRILIRHSVREGPLIGRPELVGALEELDIIPSYIVS
jgi:hypothetical protein